MHIVLVPSLGILLFNELLSALVVTIFVLIPSLGILLFNEAKKMIDDAPGKVLVPSLWILLFNVVKNIFEENYKFSSPLWGFFYLMKN